jgi:hypothetical protein
MDGSEDQGDPLPLAGHGAILTPEPQLGKEPVYRPALKNRRTCSVTNRVTEQVYCVFPLWVSGICKNLFAET